MADSAAIRIVADLKPYLDEVKKLGPMTDQEALKAAMALESRVTKAAQAASRASEKAAAAAAKAAEKAAKKSGDAMEEFGDNAEKSFSRMAKAAALTGDAFGGLAGPIGDIGDAFGMMDPRVAAVTVTLGALVGAFGAVLSISLDVIRNADDYGVALGENQTAIYSAKTALEDLDLTLNRQKATMAGVVAPAIETLSLAYIGLSDHAAEAMDKLSEGPNLDNLITAGKLVALVTMASINPSGFLQLMGSQATAIIGMVNDEAAHGAEIAKQQREEAQSLEQGMRQFQAAFSEFEREQEAAKAKAERDADRRKQDAANAAKRASDEAKRADEAAFAEFQKQFDESQRMLAQETEALGILDAFTASFPDALNEVAENIDTIGSLYEKNRQYQFDEEVRMAKEALAAKAALEAEAAAQKAAQDRAAQQEFEKSQIEGIAGISGYIGQTLGLISGMYDENTKEGRKAIREMAIAQKAAAIFDVAIKGVQAVMAALTIPPPAGPILAVAAGVTAAASAASVAAQPLPSFHSGRFAGAIQPVQPDESPAMLRRGEVVVPAPTVRANGGVDGVRQRLGERGGDGGMVLAIDLTDRRIRLPLARDMARAIPASPYLGWAF